MFQNKEIPMKLAFWFLAPMAARPVHFPATTPSVNVEALEDKAKDLETRLEDITKQNESKYEMSTKNYLEWHKLKFDRVCLTRQMFL